MQDSHFLKSVNGYLDRKIAQDRGLPDVIKDIARRKLTIKVIPENETQLLYAARVVALTTRSILNNLTLLSICFSQHLLLSQGISCFV